MDEEDLALRAYYDLLDEGWNDNSIAVRLSEITDVSYYTWKGFLYVSLTCSATKARPRRDELIRLFVYHYENRDLEKD